MLIRLLIVLNVLLATTVVAENAETVRLGIIVPLTGPAATWGEEIRDAVKLSHKHLPQGVRERLDLVFEDDQFLPRKTLSAFQRLALVPETRFIITFGGATSAAVAPLADRHRLPTFAITGATSVAASREFVFRHWVSVEDQAIVVLSLLEKFKHKRIALLLTEDEPPIQFADSFKRIIEDRGIEVIFEQAVPPSDKDFRSSCSRIIGLKPDAVVTALLPGHLGVFAKQFRILDKTTPLFGFSGSESKAEIEVASGALENLIFASSEPTREFANLFFQDYGRMPELAAPNAYDIVQIIGKAVEQQCCNRKDLNNYIRSLSSFSGALGAYGISSDNSFEIPAVAKIVKKGKFTLLEFDKSYGVIGETEGLRDF